MKRQHQIETTNYWNNSNNNEVVGKQHQQRTEKRNEGGVTKATEKWNEEVATKALPESTILPMVPKTPPSHHHHLLHHTMIIIKTTPLPHPRVSCQHKKMTIEQLMHHPVHLRIPMGGYGQVRGLNRGHWWMLERVIIVVLLVLEVEVESQRLMNWWWMNCIMRKAMWQLWAIREPNMKMYRVGGGGGRIINVYASGGMKIDESGCIICLASYFVIDLNN